jgi:hypothetical protein
MKNFYAQTAREFAATDMALAKPNFSLPKIILLGDSVIVWNGWRANGDGLFVAS